MKRLRVNLLMGVVAASTLLFTACNNNKKEDILSVSLTELNFDSDDVNEQTVNVDTNVKNWIATSSSDWIIISRENNRFTVRVANYSQTSGERSGTIVVKAGAAEEVYVSVIQSPVGVLSVNPKSFTFEINETGPKAAVISSNLSKWSFTTSSVWLKPEKKGNTLEIYADLNFDEPRTGEITVKSGNAPPVTVQVTQVVSPKPTIVLNTCEAYYYGNYYENGVANFELYLFNYPYTTKYLNFIKIDGFCTLPASGSFKLDAVTYHVIENIEDIEAGTFFDGIIDEERKLHGTFVCDHNTPKYTMINGGTFDVALDGNTYTITTNFTGVELPSEKEVTEIKYKYTGTIFFNDETENPVVGGIGESEYKATGVPSLLTKPGPSSWEGEIYPNTAEQNLEVSVFGGVKLAWFLNYRDGEFLLDCETFLGGNDKYDAYIRVIIIDEEEDMMYMIRPEEEYFVDYDEITGTLDLGYIFEFEDTDITFPALIGVAAMNKSDGGWGGVFSDFYADLKLKLSPISPAMKKFGDIGYKRKDLFASKVKSSTGKSTKTIKLDRSKLQKVPSNMINRQSLQKFQAK